MPQLRPGMAKINEFKKKKITEWYLLLILKLILSYQLQAGPLSLDSVCTEHETHDYDQFKNK